MHLSHCREWVEGNSNGIPGMCERMWDIHICQRSSINRIIRRNQGDEEEPPGWIGKGSSCLDTRTVIDAIIMKVNNNSFVRDWDFYFIIARGSAFHSIVRGHLLQIIRHRTRMGESQSNEPPPLLFLFCSPPKKVQQTRVSFVLSFNRIYWPRMTLTRFLETPEFD